MSIHCPPEINHMFVTSELRDTTKYPAANSYTLHLTHPIKDIRAVELVHAAVPNTMYNLGGSSDPSSNTNCIAVSDFDLNTAPNDYSLSKGFYSATGLQQSVQNAIQNQSNVAVTYLYSEGKFLFTRLDTFPFQLSFGNEDMSALMGFTSPPGTIYNSQTVAVPALGTNPVPLYANNATYTGKCFIKSDTIVNMHPDEGIFLDIKELRTNFTSEAMKITDQGDYGTYSGMNMNRSFGMIPMDVSGGVVKSFKKTSDYDFTVDYPHPITSLDRLTIQWIDKNGKVVDFNGANDHSFMLRFHTGRKNLCH